MKYDSSIFDEQDCFEQLIKLKWKYGFKCKKCGNTDYWIKPDRRIVICKACRKEYSPLSDTMFSRSHISLQNWFKIIYLICCSPDKVITAKGLYEELGLGSYRTAYQALKKIRFAISMNKPKFKLNGNIELDELVITGICSEYRKISILGAMEIEGKRRLSLTMIKNPDEMNMKYYFRKQLKKNVTVISDPEKLYIRNWLALNRINQIGSVDYYGTKFMGIHVILQDVKYGLKNGHHGVSEKQLQQNLDEFTFIFNHNRNRGRAFKKLLKYMVETNIKEYRKYEKSKNAKNPIKLLQR